MQCIHNTFAKQTWIWTPTISRLTLEMYCGHLYDGTTSVRDVPNQRVRLGCRREGRLSMGKGKKGHATGPDLELPSSPSRGFSMNHPVRGVLNQRRELGSGS
jgi:hypothetical protein